VAEGPGAVRGCSAAAVTKAVTETAIHTVDVSCMVLIMGERRVPLAIATASPAAIPAALEAQPSRASLRHRGRSCGHISLMVIHQG
jgi:hypothetical protein